MYKRDWLRTWGHRMAVIQLNEHMRARDRLTYMLWSGDLHAVIKGEMAILTEKRVLKDPCKPDKSWFDCKPSGPTHRSLGCYWSKHTCFPPHKQSTHNRQIPAFSHSSCMYTLQIGSCHISKNSTKYAMYPHPHTHTQTHTQALHAVQ